MRRLQIKWLVKECVITRAQAKKLRQQKPIEIHGGQFIKLCRETIKKYYAAAVDEDDMKLRTAGTAERVEGYDRLMLQECFEYLQ